MKKVIRFIQKNIIVILVVLIIANSLFLYWLQQRNVPFYSESPNYHFYFVGQNSVDPYWKEIRRGVEDAAKDYNVVVEFNSPRFNNPAEELKYLDMAISARVDGIITHVSNVQGSTELINRGYTEGIPIVTIENDNKNSNRNAFVGTNSFLLGKEAGELMVEATNGRARVAIVVNSDLDLDSASQNLKMNGFLSAIKEYPDMQVAEVYTSQLGILSAEEITQNIINHQSEINAILTTSSVDTLGAAQIIVDRNKVGSICLVGYGDLENILRYIMMDIIYGTVISDPYQMGYEAVKALIDIKDNNNVSTFIDTGVKVITRENIHDYTYDYEEGQQQ
ncbi:substrate-binding domain-containing protein [Alkaliphilus crotonatoxidans]